MSFKNEYAKIFNESKIYTAHNYGLRNNDVP